MSKTERHRIALEQASLALDYTVRFPNGTVQNEARRRAGIVVTGVRNRIQHPTYGYDKAGIVADLNVLRGLLDALGLLREERTTDRHLVAWDLGIDLDALRIAVEHC